MRNTQFHPDSPRLQILRHLAGLLFALLLMASLPIPEAHGTVPGPSADAAALG